MSKPTDISADDQRGVVDLLIQGKEWIDKHPEVKTKVLDLFSSLASRDISPDQERELSTLAQELKNDLKGARDISSENVSPEDQQRDLLTTLGAIKKFHDANPQVAKTFGTFVSGLF